MGTDRISFTSSSPTSHFYLEGDVVDTDESYGANGRWKVRLYLRAVNGGSGNYFLNSGYHAAYLNGSEKGRTTRDPFLPSTGSGATRWRTGPYDVWVNANANGYWSGSSESIPVQMRTAFGNINDYRSGSVPLPRIERAPGKPGKPSISNLTPTGAKFTWAAAARGSSAIEDYGLYVSTSASFTTHAFADWIGTNTNRTLSGVLAPGTKYYARVRARNDDGTGVYSDVTEFTTLPATPPGLGVTPSVSGTQATVVVTPPAGTTGVTSYLVEIDHDVPGIGGDFTLTPPVTERVVDSLIPGELYQWRASAFYGTYQTPFSSWLPVLQPNPNTTPGQFFDGNSADTDEVTYVWFGTANNSESHALSNVPTGWTTFAEGVGATGADGVVASVRDNAPDAAGPLAARAIFTADATAAGFLLGAYSADIEGQTQYVGSIWAKSSKKTRLRARMTFYDTSDVEVVSYDGEEVVVEANVWTRLTVTQQSPPNGDEAGIFVQDVAGTDHELWQGGDQLTADAAMVSLAQLYPYFDGATPDTVEFLYEWLATANASRSRRRDRKQSTVDPLADPDCTPLPTPPALPTIETDCIEEIGDWRRYMIVIPATEIREWSSTLPTLELQTGSFAERQVRIRVYPNPDNVTPDLIDATVWDAEMILTFIPKNTRITLDGVTERVWATLTNGRTIPADQLLFGTGGIPATWPELRCGIGYVMTLDVPLEAPSGNLETSVILTQRM